MVLLSMRGQEKPVAIHNYMIAGDATTRIAAAAAATFCCDT